MFESINLRGSHEQEFSDPNSGESTILLPKEGFLMANTFSQIYIQTVFAVSGRLALITPDFKEELHKYITGIVTKQKQKLIRINGMPFDNESGKAPSP